MQLKKHISILFAGRGGQGVLSASFIAAHAFFSSGYDVKKSDIRGLARRGGRVLSTLIAGEKVYNPKIATEMVDIAVLFSEDHDFLFSENTVLISPADEEAEKFPGNLNIFCLGKLSILLNIPLEIWEQSIKERFDGSASKLSLSAFYEGRTVGEIMEVS
jgi:indolepyruvate ferredoxin oxidoreductase beta subunit